MFFRRKKQRGSAPPPLPEAGGTPAGRESARAVAPSTGERSGETEFLTGDALEDRRSVESLLDEIARISERVARVAGSDDLVALLTYIVDASIERTGAERGLLVLARKSSADGEEGATTHEVAVARQRGARDIAGEVRYSTSAVNRVLETGQPLKDMFNSAAEAMDLGASVFDLKLRALMCVPLEPDRGVERSGPRGALYVDSKAATREFTGKDLSYFNALSRQIAVALESARLHLDSLERARLEESLETARAVQSNLMPQVPTFAGFELFGWYRAAERTSGDFYDFFRTKGGDLGVVVGDVTGHGPASALITSTAQASLRSIMRVLDDPSVALTMLNQDLAERMEQGLFVTLFLAILGKDGSVRGINAGHASPLLWHRADGSIETVGGRNPALGMIADFEYEAAQPIAMQPGDALVVYSDGLTEARAKERPDALFGEEGLARLLAERAPQAAGARELTEAIVAEVLEFARGNREDDMTFVTVRRTGGA